MRGTGTRRVEKPPAAEAARKSKQPATLADLAGRSVPVERGEAVVSDAGQAARSYEEFLRIADADPALRAQALRRLGDLRLGEAEALAAGGEVQSAEAGQREAVAFYQQTILGAFGETNDALVGSLKKREEAEAQARRVAALRDYARLSRLKFDNGYAGYLEVLYAENELFSGELTSVRSLAERYAQIVSVFRAVGGGWVGEADKLAPQPQLGSPSAASSGTPR